MIYSCGDRLRRQLVKNSALNGIDYLEVLDHEAPAWEQRQRTLFVHLLNAQHTAGLTPANFRIDGGARVRDVTVTEVQAGAGDQAGVLTVEADKPGDFSSYRLHLVKDAEHPEPPTGFDPTLASVEFSFKVECPSDFDCRQARVCPSEALEEPEIDYLAKDYASFRRLMLDRMAALMPRWTERHEADAGVVLVELLAYLGDQLSYQQDAVATEAYLSTARRRISVRRHARLVDYFVGEGSNARAWVQVEVSADVLKAAAADPPALPQGTRLCTRIPGQAVRLSDDFELLERADAVFETMHDLDELHAAHNSLSFYTWSDRECRLPRGAVRATLKGHLPKLKAGDVLIFEELLGPTTGVPEDADPSHRHALRLLEVVSKDAQGQPLTDPLNQQPITEIRWGAEDALPFPLSVSARLETDLEDVSVARGNIVLADHGLRIEGESLGLAPESPRFRPRLKEQPLTHAALYDPAQPASAAMTWASEAVLPWISLGGALDQRASDWRPERDLLDSGPADPHFVVEIDTDGAAFLRFGDGQYGSRPEPGTALTATYRVGNGTAGNVGAEALVHIVTGNGNIARVRNPLAARGGVEPESLEDARQRAPSAFRTEERAVTPEDYAEVAERHSGVQRAAATFRWTGSWYTVFLTVDRLGGLEVDAGFEEDLRRHLERYRMAGHDVEIDSPRFVSLEVEMEVSVKPDYFRSDVRIALLEAFSNRMLADGRPGLFHPDNFTFGQPVYLSRLYAAAQAVAGVASVKVTICRRQGSKDAELPEEGRLVLGRLEVARLDNDPNFPERGVLRLLLEGGK